MWCFGSHRLLSSCCPCRRSWFAASTAWVVSSNFCYTSFASLSSLWSTSDWKITTMITVRASWSQEAKFYLLLLLRASHSTRHTSASIQVTAAEVEERTETQPRGEPQITYYYHLDFVWIFANYSGPKGPAIPGSGHEPLIAWTLRKCTSFVGPI